MVYRVQDYSRLPGQEVAGSNSPAERVLDAVRRGWSRGHERRQSRETSRRPSTTRRPAVRILIATDAASEGLNLHLTARHLLHYDCPWNPSRLEQRNGRLDRYGQARDVCVHHFVSESDPDIHFLDLVIRKADEIRGRPRFGQRSLRPRRPPQADTGAATCA